MMLISGRWTNLAAAARCRWWSEGEASLAAIHAAYWTEDDDDGLHTCHLKAAWPEDELPVQFYTWNPKRDGEQDKKGESGKENDGTAKHDKQNDEQEFEWQLQRELEWQITGVARGQAFRRKFRRARREWRRLQQSGPRAD